jgi:hypothetical protein
MIAGGECKAERSLILFRCLRQGGKNPHRSRPTRAMHGPARYRFRLAKRQAQDHELPEHGRSCPGRPSKPERCAHNGAREKRSSHTSERAHQPHPRSAARGLLIGPNRTKSTHAPAFSPAQPLPLTRSAILPHRLKNPPVPLPPHFGPVALQGKGQRRRHLASAVIAVRQKMTARKAPRMSRRASLPCHRPLSPRRAKDRPPAPAKHRLPRRRKALPHASENMNAR